MTSKEYKETLLKIAEEIDAIITTIESNNKTEKVDFKKVASANSGWSLTDGLTKSSANAESSFLDFILK